MRYARGVSGTRSIRVSAEHARRFHRRAVGLDDPAPDVAAALARWGYVQIDPINVCGRMHDLVLRNRVTGYREGDLGRHLHADGALAPSARRAFEHFLPSSGVLAAFPLDAWPYLQRAMRLRGARDDAWSGRLEGDERALADSLLAEIARRGPSSSEDFDDPRRARAVWGAATLVKSVLQRLFYHGRLLVARRGAGQRRVYDLPERVLPAEALTAREPDEADSLRWDALLRLRQRRLVTLTKRQRAHVDDAVVEITVIHGPTLLALRDDLPLLDAAAEPATARAEPLLLAPLDPLVYDRKVTAALWGFDYTWEVYTPPAKRTRGYYALPVLAGAELVGHVDPKADRDAGTLRVMGRAVKRGHATTGAVRALAAWLGLRAR